MSPTSAASATNASARNASATKASAMQAPAMISRSEVHAMVDTLFAQHLDGTWKFQFDHARRRAGTCNYTLRTITLSKHILKTTLDDIEQVLLHEIAHALAGSSAGHGPRWKSIARNIGYIGGRTTMLNLAEDEAPWVGHCPAGHRFVRFRRPSGKSSCRGCHRGFHEAHLIRWEYQR